MMHSVGNRIKNAFVSVEQFVLKFRGAVLAVGYVLKGTTSAPGEETSKPILEESDNLYDAAVENSQQSIFQAYVANYNGTTCLQQACARSSTSCCTCTHSIVSFTRRILSFLLNLLCYPFVPCVAAFLPKTFKSIGYTNYNKHPCNTEMCCYLCKVHEEKSICKFCCAQHCLLIWASLLLAVGCLILWNLTQDTSVMIQVLLYFENINQVTSVFLFIILFTLVSFPMLWGYVILNLAAGYLYGFFLSIPVVVFSVTFGVAVAHIICKKYFSTCVMKLLQRRSNFNQIEAILQVIEGSSGLKVVALTRLTPIPFGFQNGLFAVSNISLRYYVLASNIGLLPTQVLNCYIGSTFRSMDQLMKQNSAGGYMLFFLQVAIGIGLMIFVIRHARRELATALQSSSITVEPISANQTTYEQTSEPLTEVKCSQPTSPKLSSYTDPPILDV
ncbi:unnamed protein product [Clavelina lepadiformis]|uniref:VTT domain-containing protein n=1 Tax=Clavelina lepadiformis TaxID=159417 RepID=A0ABP0G1D7_CLALP